MNPRRILLVSPDVRFHTLLSRALPAGGAIVHVARNAGEALRIVCELAEPLDLAVIDFDDGCHGMTLLSALHACQPDLAVIALISKNAYHAAAVGYANGAAACLANPISAAELRTVIETVGEPKLQLASA